MAMPKTCDNKSVGVIIRHGNSLLLIKRKNFPVSFAFVAGHLDGDTFEDAAKKEALEEVRIAISELKELWGGTLMNPCKRDDGRGHEWKVFEAAKWDGTPQAGSDAKETFWASPEELGALRDKSIVFLKKHGFLTHNFDLRKATIKIAADEEWQKNPGLELVWCFMLQKM